MKSKIITLSCLLQVFLLLLCNRGLAQQPMARQSGTYTYKVFQAPNKMFGYDIFIDGKLVFHQFANTTQPGKNNPPQSGSSRAQAATPETGSMISRADAEQAAMLAMEKIKAGQRPETSKAETKKITAQ